MSVRPRILIVEDDAAIRRVLDRILNSEFDITFCENGLEALDYLKESERFELICTDLNMPLMDGFELITAARTLPNYVHTPIVVVSAWSDSKSKQTVLELGAVDLISKPFEAAEILNKFKNLIHIKRDSAADYQNYRRIFDKVVEDRDLFNSMVENEHLRSIRSISNLVLAYLEIPSFEQLTALSPKNADTIRVMLGQFLLSAFRRPNDRLGYLGNGRFMVATSNLEESYYSEYLESLMQQISELGIHHNANPPSNTVSIIVGGVSLDPGIKSEHMNEVLVALASELTKAISQPKQISFRHLAISDDGLQ